MADSPDQHDKPRFVFIDPENPPPGVDLSELPPGVDINELIFSAYISDGELALAKELDEELGNVEMSDEERREAEALTIEIAQQVIDDYLFDPSDPD